jgi:Skp family chaperone for outer membrane proteins
MVSFINFAVVPAFTFMANNMGLVAAVLGPLVGIVGLVNVAMAMLELQTKLTTLTAAGATSATAKLAAAALSPVMGLFRLAASVFAATLPFLKIAAPILLALAAFKYLYEAGFTVGDVFEAVGDNMKKLMLTLADGFLWLLDKVTFGDVNKKIKDAQKAVDLEREELKEKEKARDQRRREKREERGIKEEENKLSKEAIELQKKENDAKKEGAATTTPSPAYDLSTPEKMFESAMRRQQGATQQPGASTAQPGKAASPVPASTGLGGMAARFESGAAGSAAVGWDSTGGTSFGKYQIATKTGTMDRFMEHLKKTNPEAYERLSKAGPADTGKEGKFAQEWKKLAGEGKLQQSEHDFIKATHYDVGAAGLKDQNLKGMLEKSKALQEVMWSTSVQHGGGGASGIFNKVFKEGMTEQDLIKAIYAERGTKFGSSTAQVRSSVQNRFAQEQQLALGMVGQPGTAVASATPTAPATPTATAAQTAVAQAPAAAPTKPTTTPPVQTAQAPAAQESPSTLLASLNTKMDVLIALNRKANDTRDRQLSAAKTSPSDVSAWAAA